MIAARIPSRPPRHLVAVAGLAQPLPMTFLGFAALAFVAEALAVDPRLVAAIASLLPVDIAAPDPAVAVATALGLAALALGLRRGKRLAWWLAVATFTSGLIAQALMLGHPIGAAVAGACLLFLAADRVQYRTLSDARWRRRFAILLAVGLGAALVELAVGLVASGEWQREPLDPGDFVAAVVSWFAFGDPSAAVPVGPGVLLAILPLAARLPVVLGIFGILRPADAALDPMVQAHGKQVTRRFGHGALLPFQLGDDKLQFSLPDREGTVVYGLAGRMAVVLGDPVGPDAWLVFEAFLASCRERDLVPVVYQASRLGRQILEAAGFRCFQVGQEAIVDLADFSLAGSRRANLRHTVTRARRGGVATSWYPNGLRDVDPSILAELAEIDRIWRAGAGPELGFTISRFDARELERCAVSLAVDADEGVLAFATFRPTGTDGGWVLDLLRRLPGAVPGAMEACLVQAAESLRDAGAARLSLGLAPLAGLRSGNGPMEERLLAGAARLARPFYDVAGLAFFKGKFDPIWEPRYGAVRARRDLPGLVGGLLRLHLGSSRRALLRAAAVALPQLGARATPGARRKRAPAAS